MVIDSVDSILSSARRRAAALRWDSYRPILYIIISYVLQHCIHFEAAFVQYDMHVT